MRVVRIVVACALAGTGSLLAGCSDGTRPPTEVERDAAPPPPSALHVPVTETFTYRAAVDPFRIQQLPDFMMQSHAVRDVVMQRSIFAPGPGGWHTHAGPSFVYVIEGQIKLVEYSEKEGCTETPVRGPGEVYFEEGGHVHRAVVVSSESAVLMVTRFNIPPGSPIALPATDPGC